MSKINIKRNNDDLTIKKEEIESRIKNATLLSNKLIGTLERTFISDTERCNIERKLPHNLEIDLAIGKTVWIKIDQIGYNADEKVDRYFSALRNIFKAFSISGLKLLFLVLGNEGNYSLYLGILCEKDERVPIANEMSDFIESSWAGTRTSVIREKSEDDNLKSFYKGRYSKCYALTGIPSLDINKEFPSTVENLMAGNNNGKFAYLVVSEAVSIEKTNKIISICRDKQGELETYKSANINQSFQLGNAHGSFKGEGHGNNYGVNGNVGLGIVGIGGYGGSFTNQNTGTNDIDSYNQSVAIGSNIVNKSIEAVLSYLKKYEDRFESGKANGMWKIGCYLFVGEKANTTNIQLKSILSGDGSKYEPIRISDISNLLEQDINCPDNCNLIPFVNPPKLVVAKEGKTVEHLFGKEYSELSTILTTNEMSSLVNFPIHSLPGIIVRDIPLFGRGVVHSRNSEKSSSTIKLGKIVHQGKNSNNELCISEALLSSHTFICGSTGSGKSNTIYYLLDKLIEEKDKHFLVIEPAKGEYKDVFGGRKDINVFGTNPNTSRQLHVNIFAFPNSIHIEEHIDRLIDIFNACWPMYAAMPAVLKESICRAYKSCGWDLDNSENEYNYYPNISDVVRELRKYINESEYSADSKGDYKGALVTRLESLSNGIIGQVFSGNPIDDSELFDKNVIVDLSRVGSVETKALLMGILVMKLNEYRMQQRFEGKITANQPLTHITVLEEAHNLLKSTGQFQSQESSNILGKSVEMLTTAIAEMRTYGEGFIIADQSPSMLDQAVISNTNTKIIMNLPNRIDRQISGDSISLTSKQQLEISKLETGQAVIFQKGWQEPILCQINKFDSFSPYNYDHPQPQRDAANNNNPDFLKDLYSIFAEGHKIDKEKVSEYVEKASICDSQKYHIKKKLRNTNTISPDMAAEIFACYVGLDLFDDLSKKYSTSSTYFKEFNSVLDESLSEMSPFVRDHLTYFVNMYVLGCNNINHLNFYNTWNILNSKLK